MFLDEIDIKLCSCNKKLTCDIRVSFLQRNAPISTSILPFNIYSTYLYHLGEEADDILYLLSKGSMQ